MKEERQAIGAVAEVWAKKGQGKLLSWLLGGSPTKRHMVAVLTGIVSLIGMQAKPYEKIALATDIARATAECILTYRQKTRAGRDILFEPIHSEFHPEAKGKAIDQAHGNVPTKATYKKERKEKQAERKETVMAEAKATRDYRVCKKCGIVRTLRRVRWTAKRVEKEETFLERHAQHEDNCDGGVPRDFDTYTKCPKCGSYISPQILKAAHREKCDGKNPGKEAAEKAIAAAKRAQGEKKQAEKQAEKKEEEAAGKPGGKPAPQKEKEKQPAGKPAGKHAGKAAGKPAGKPAPPNRKREGAAAAAGAPGKEEPPAQRQGKPAGKKAGKPGGEPAGAKRKQQGAAAAAGAPGGEAPKKKGRPEEKEGEKERKQERTPDGAGPNPPPK
eukprot:gene7057-6046_t